MTIVSFSHEQVTCRVLRKGLRHPLEGCPNERDLAAALKKARELNKLVKLQTSVDGSGDPVTLLIQPPAPGVEPAAPFKGYIFRPEDVYEVKLTYDSGLACVRIVG